jgi:hypothetical protein
MKNRIHLVNDAGRSLSPMEAEVRLTVFADHVTPTTEIRGRLVGPRCRFATTVEVAYPLRSPPHERGEIPPLTVCAVIPEPCLWDTQSPFLYRALVELWEDGERCDQAQFDVGLASLTMGTSGLYWNGKRLALRGTTRLPASDAEALRLRQAGYNLLLAPVAQIRTWFTAYEVGFLVLGRLALSEQALRQASVAGAMVSCLGWLLDKELTAPTPEQAAFLAAERQRGRVIALELDRVPSLQRPADLDLLVCKEKALRGLTRVNIPKLIATDADAAHPSSPFDLPGVVGWVEM